MARVVPNKRYNTHDFVKDFIKASESRENSVEKQAEVIVKAIAQVQDSSMENTATKADIQSLEAKMNTNVQSLEAKINEVKKDIQISEQRVIIRLGSLMTAGIFLIAALIKL